MKRPEHSKYELRPFWRNHIWALRLLQIVIIPVWPFILLGHFIRGGILAIFEVFPEVWENIETIWSKFHE